MADESGAAPPGGEDPGDADDGGLMRVVGRNLPLAIVSGLTLAVAFVGSVLWHPAAFSVLVAALCVLAYLEAGRVLAAHGRRPQVAVLVVATLVMLAGAYSAGHAGQAIGLAVLFAGAVSWQLADPRRDRVVTTLATTMLFGLWVGFLASFGVLLVTRPSGQVAVLAVVGGAALSDVGAYAVGSRLGRHRIAPSISPHKSWEGLIGGVVTAAILAALIVPLLDPAFGPLTAGAVAAVAGLAGSFGDLVESMVKRDLGVKDLGAILPGHGGVLDRVDGILLALPVGWLSVLLLL